MRKNALAMSVAALVGSIGFVGAASADVIPGTGAAPTNAVLGAATATALQLAPGGIGHQLITPYFNAQNGNATITDTVNGKVMKVRFRGASNSDDILDFTVLMSPGDVWTAQVTASGTGPATLTTNDKTCTLPQLVAGQGQPFVTNRLTTKGGNDINNNTREGYIEIFNMADIPSAAVYGAGGTSNSALYTAIKHVNGTPPCTGSAINAAIFNNNWTPATEANAAAQGLATPTTGLFGNWTIINVPQTTTFSGSMVAVQAVIGLGGAQGRGNFVVFPQSATAYGNADAVTADPLLRQGGSTCTALTGAVPAVCTAGAGGPAIPAAFFDLPDMSTPYVTTSATPLAQAATLTGALAVLTITNEYATDPIITAKTDWVFSMPTRRYSVAMDYTPATSRRLYSQVVGAGNAAYFHDGNTRINPNNSQQICVDATAQVFYDREEITKSSGAVFSPGNISVTTFCGETSVLSFNDTGVSVLGGGVARQDTGSSAFVNGWGTVNVTNGTTGLGLPIMGAAFIKGTNPAVAAGQSGTYGVTSEHRFTR